jgi:hypothetical protein
MIFIVEVDVKYSSRVEQRYKGSSAGVFTTAEEPCGWSFIVTLLGLLVLTKSRLSTI